MSFNLEAEIVIYSVTALPGFNLINSNYICTDTVLKVLFCISDIITKHIPDNLSNIKSKTTYPVLLY